MPISSPNMDECLPRPAEDQATSPGDMLGLIEQLYPICRSITGDGVRRSLSLLQAHIPLEIREVPSGTQVFDWVVPKEWNIRDAYLKNTRGERVIDFRSHNLHVVNYSIPVHQKMSLPELLPYLHTIPEQPDWIPYRTSYYKENWGFCLSQNQLDRMEDTEYEVCIDSTLAAGSLTYGELFLPGDISDEILISAHSCHPSLCNDNLSGVAVATFLAKQLMSCERHYSFRFLFIPGTIGAITWLSLNEKRLGSIKHGLVLTCLGDSGYMHYKQSRYGNAPIDRAISHVLKHSGNQHEIMQFSPYGYDERQYCSPGINLAVGCLMRTPHGMFPEYHSSADNLALMNRAKLDDSLLTCRSAIEILETNRKYVNRNPKCEPQLGRRGLYRSMGGHRDEKLQETAMLWVLNQSDGDHALLDIAERSGLRFDLIKGAADRLEKHDLLVQYSQSAFQETKA